jgi:DHA1 family multidrug resistance protein-like MFS transporter
MPHIIKQVFPILGLSVFCSTIGIGIITPLIPLYAHDLGATGTWMGVIVAAYSIARIITIPFIGPLSDRKGRKIIIVVGLFTFIISSLGYVWANNIASLILIRLVQGMAAGIVLPTIQAYIGDITPVGEEGKWMSYYNISFATGFACGPLMGGLLTDYLGMNAAFYGMAFCNLLAFLGVLLFVPETVPKGKASTPYSALFKGIAANRVMWGIFSFRLGLASYRGILITFLPVFAAIYVGLSPSQIGILLTVNAFVVSVMQIPSGRLADRFDRRALMVLGGFISLIAMALMPAFNEFWYLLAVFLFLSFGDAGALPAASAMVVKEGKILGMGIAMAMFNISIGIGQAISPIVGGVIADYIGISSVFYFAAATILVGTGAFYWFTR